jgi:hypothetical protein
MPPIVKAVGKIVVSVEGEYITIIVWGDGTATQVRESPNGFEYSDLKQLHGDCVSVYGNVPEKLVKEVCQA